MRQTLELKVPKPCSADWQSMTTSDGGRFCLSCQKQVVDFSTLNAGELKEYFKQYKGNVCGRFQPQQLKTYPLHHTGNSTFFKLLALAGLSFIVTAAQAYQKPTAVTTHTEPSVSPRVIQAAAPDSTNKYNVTGRVFYTAGDSLLPLPGAAIHIKGTKLGTTADASGNFEITFNSLPREPIFVKVLFIGFVPLEEKLDFSSSKTLDLGTMQLTEELFLMGEVVVVRHNPLKSFWWRIRNTFR